MTPKALAEALNGIEYSATIHLHGSDLMKLAKGAGLVVAYGFSDDLLEFDGALYDEFGCYDGGTALIDADGLLPEFESAARTKRLIALMLHDTLNDRRSVAREIGCAEAELTVSRDRIPRGFAEAVEHAYKTINE
jgi:hypothetical protein